MNGSTDKRKTFTNGGSALLANRLVKLSSGVLAYAGAGEDSVGVLVDNVAANAQGTVKLHNDCGSFAVTAAGIYASELDVYPAANGKVSTTVSGKTVGRLVEASAADGDVVEIVKVSGGGEAATVAHIPDAAQTQTALVDNGGGTADLTVASQAAPVTITDSTGLNASHDDTIAAVAVAVGTLTGTADGTLEVIGSTSGGDVSGAISNNFQDLRAAILINSQNCSDLGQKAIELVALAGTAQNNLKEVTTELALIKTDVSVCVSKINSILAALEGAGIVAAS